MNAILFTGDSSPISDEEVKVFKDAEKIINNNKKKKHPVLIVLSIIIVILFLAFLVLSTIFALLNINSDKIVNGVSVVGIDISNLTKQEALDKLNAEFSNRISKDIVLKHNDELYSFIPSQIEGNYDVNKVVDQAYTIGRDGNIFQNNYSIIKTWYEKIDLTPNFSYKEDSFTALVEQMNTAFADGVKDPSYVIDEKNLIITPGKDGYAVQMDKLEKLVVNKLTADDYNTDAIEIPTTQKKCDAIDIDKIHSEIYQEASDAYFTKDPYTVHASTTGMDFKISVDEAKALITGTSDTYTIPLKILYPKVRTSDIGSEAFPNLLASFSTSYATSNSNRSTNIALATAKIDGKVLMPGETFSYNQTVGQRTAQSGFKEAGVYVNGGVSTGIGGGICQVSSTLYNAVLRANLEIVDRTNHQFQVGYVPIGTDATVSWGSPDFKFKNSRSYPVKISATTSGKNIYIKIFGLHESTEYDVEIVSYKTATIAYSTTYTKDSSLGAGKTKVVQAGSNGAKSETYRILKLNGAVVSKTLLSKDTYSPHNQIIAQGQ